MTSKTLLFGLSALLVFILINAPDGYAAASICQRTLSGSPLASDVIECHNANGVIFCGNGWCSCSCPTGTPSLTITGSTPSASIGGHVSITGLALYSQGYRVSQWGQPGVLAFYDHSTGTVTQNSQSIWASYTCIAPGTVPLKLYLVNNNQVVKAVSISVTCKIGSPRMLETGSKITARKGDTVWITAKAVDAAGASVSQWGTPGILQYVSRSAGSITQDNQDIWVAYKCVNAGTASLKFMIIKNNQLASAIVKTVTCTQ